MQDCPQQLKKGTAPGQWLPWAVLLAATGLLLWRCFYSFCASDESYYLAMVHRFWMGQQPVVEEWNSAQLYAILLLPFYSIYRAIAGGAQGVYLAARILYVLLAGGTAFVLYGTLKSQSRAGALAGALLILFYSKANIGGLSYYGVCFLCVLMTLLLLIDWKPGKGGALRAFAAGILFSLAVVCMPFLAAAVLFLIVPLVVKRLRPWRSAVWWFVGGIAAAAAVYCAILFSQVGLADLLAHVPYVLNDPDNHEMNLLYLLMRYFANPVYQFIYTLPLWGGAGLYTLWCLFRKKVLDHRTKNWILAVSGAALVVNLLLSGDILGKGHTALCLFAIQCWLLTPADKKPWKAMWGFFVPGLVFALIWQMSSNTQFSGMTVGFAVSAVGAALMVPPCLEQVKMPCKMSEILLCIALAGPVLVGGWQRLALVYRDAPLSQCTARLEEGPGAGLYTSPAHKEQYNQVCADLHALGHEDEPLFISSLLPWGYLCTDRPVGSPNTWRTLVDSPLLEVYYQVNPQNLPADVLVLDAEIGDYVSTIQPEENAEPNYNAQDSSFLQMLLDQGYTVHRVSCGTVYSRPE